MKILLPIFYLPPISWFSEFLKEENEVVLEQSRIFRSKRIETEPMFMAQTVNCRLSFLFIILAKGALKI